MGSIPLPPAKQNKKKNKSILTQNFIIYFGLEAMSSGAQGAPGSEYTGHSWQGWRDHTCIWGLNLG